MLAAAHAYNINIRALYHGAPQNFGPGSAAQRDITLVLRNNHYNPTISDDFPSNTNPAEHPQSVYVEPTAVDNPYDGEEIELEAISCNTVTHAQHTDNTENLADHQPKYESPAISYQEEYLPLTLGTGNTHMIMPNIDS